ncbi:MAG: hypothetical protein JSW11_16735 [Candidatus Heimdallarchaeota archaeon]|nr:MAG: hypothetical protein JSW11_16735 [Candidatus Heimdallarchaeota archaeon]
MSMNNIFNCLLVDKNTEPLYEVIQKIKDSIPQSQRIGKGIVWTLRQLRQKIIAEKVPISVKKQSLEVLINNGRWQVRHLASLIARNCSFEEINFIFVLPVIETAADISRRHPNLVIKTLQKWLDKNTYDKKTLFITRKACRRVIKSHPDEVNKLLKGKPIIK